jgi:hypothetical protein
MRITLILLSTLSITTQSSNANPYWDPSKVPQTQMEAQNKAQLNPISHEQAQDAAIEILRIQIDWQSDESYRIAEVRRERSGTQSLVRRSKNKNPLGSYHGILTDKSTGQVLAYDAIGTGREYRKLVRALTFRFPLFDADLELVLIAEHPVSGFMEEVLRQDIAVPPTTETPTLPAAFDIQQIYANPDPDALKVVFYAEGYAASQKSSFFQHALRAYEALKNNRWPQVDAMDFTAVFAASATPIGTAENLGLPVPERNSFLGLYYPYWNNFGRWHHVVYPTRESKYRQALALVPYDYPITLIDSEAYWGVGNFNELTAIPSRNSSFVYLLLHELGHYFGLNEEYEGGGRTELEFAKNISEPWSQNITFAANLLTLKWSQFVRPSTPIPTANSRWNPSTRDPLGAYRGGYADSPSTSASHKPGLSCTMNRSTSFCSICNHAIGEKIAFDRGL